MRDLFKKAQAIRLLALDIDGILTNGHIYYSDDGVEIRGFHVHDGMGIQLLQRAGIQVAVISSKKSTGISKRMAELHIQDAYLGYEHKLPAYEELKAKFQLDDHEMAYMGDDLPDLPLLRLAGLSITVPQAPAIIKQHIDYVTKKEGGAGAVREVCELLLYAQDKHQNDR